MARLTMAGRKSLGKDEFAVPEKAPGPCSLPVPDSGHCAAARRECGKCGGDACARVDAKCKAKGF